jgi:hypothetical protein
MLYIYIYIYSYKCTYSFAAIVIPWMGASSFFGVFHLVAFNGVSLLALFSHLAAMTTNPGAVSWIPIIFQLFLLFQMLILFCLWISSAHLHSYPLNPPFFTLKQITHHQNRSSTDRLGAQRRIATEKRLLRVGPGMRCRGYGSWQQRGSSSKP